MVLCILHRTISSVCVFTLLSHSCTCITVVTPLSQCHQHGTGAEIRCVLIPWLRTYCCVHFVSCARSSPFKHRTRSVCMFCGAACAVMLSLTGRQCAGHVHAWAHAANVFWLLPGGFPLIMSSFDLLCCVRKECRWNAHFVDCPVSRAAAGLLLHVRGNCARFCSSLQCCRRMQGPGAVCGSLLLLNRLAAQRLGFNLTVTLLLSHIRSYNRHGDDACLHLFPEAQPHIPYVTNAGVHSARDQ
jgi:hypothetical protein